VVTRRESGFSMMEGAIALAVLSVIATAVLTTGSSEMRYFARSHEETVASRAAASEIERLSASASAPAEGEETFALGGDAASQLRLGTGRRTVTRVEPGLWRVEVETTWDAADGGQGRVRLATLLAREVRR
jgi:Tfp pilus assembly protein PilV